MCKKNKRSRFEAGVFWGIMHWLQLLIKGAVPVRIYKMKRVVNYRGTFCEQEGLAWM